MSSFSGQSSQQQSRQKSHTRKYRLIT